MRPENRGLSCPHFPTAAPGSWLPREATLEPPGTPRPSRAALVDNELPVTGEMQAETQEGTQA